LARYAPDVALTAADNARASWSKSLRGEHPTGRRYAVPDDAYLKCQSHTGEWQYRKARIKRHITEYAKTRDNHSEAATVIPP